MQTPILTGDAPAPIGPYSQAIRAGDYLFCSGQVALDPASGELVGADAPSQARQAMKNVAAVLKAGGASFANVVKTTIFLVDMRDFAEVNKVYGEAFPQNPPARSTIAVAGLPKGARVEIEVIAHLG